GRSGRTRAAARRVPAGTPTSSHRPCVSPSPPRPDEAAARWYALSSPRSALRSARGCLMLLPVSIETHADLEGLRRVGRVVALTLEETRRSVEPGVTTAELD